MNIINNIVISDYSKKNKLLKFINIHYPPENITRIKKLFTKEVFTDEHYNKIIEDLDKKNKSYDYILHVFPPETLDSSDDIHKIQFKEEDIKLFLTMDRFMYTDEEYEILQKWLDIHKKIYNKFNLSIGKELVKGTQMSIYFNNDLKKVITFYMVWGKIINDMDVGDISNILSEYDFGGGKGFDEYLLNMLTLAYSLTSSTTQDGLFIRKKIDDFRKKNNLSDINWILIE
jgi:hypothetical protein